MALVLGGLHVLPFVLFRILYLASLHIFSFPFIFFLLLISFPVLTQYKPYT